MRDQRRRFLALAVVVGVVGLVPASAEAQQFYVNAGAVTKTAPAGCAVGTACIYEHANWGGGKAQRTGGDSDWRSTTDVFNNGVNMNDRASSIFNNSSTYTRRFFRDTGYGGYILCIAPKTGVKDLALIEWVEDGYPGPRRYTMTDRISGHSSHTEHIDNLNCHWRAK